MTIDVKVFVSRVRMKERKKQRKKPATTEKRSCECIVQQNSRYIAHIKQNENL